MRVDKTCEDRLVASGEGRREIEGRERESRE